MPSISRSLLKLCALQNRVSRFRFLSLNVRIEGSQNFGEALIETSRCFDELMIAAHSIYGSRANQVRHYHDAF